MKIHGLGYCTNLYLSRVGVVPEDRIRLSARDYLRLIQYSEQFFRQAPTAARRAAKMSDPGLIHGFEMATAAIFDRQELNIPFIVGYIYAVQHIKEYFVPHNAQLTVWSRRYINEMPREIRKKIFAQKLPRQVGYQQFLAAYPTYQFIDIHDLSSGRFYSQRSVYQVIFLDTATGKQVQIVLKPASTIYKIASVKPINEEFYSRYLAYFGRNPVKINLYDELNFAEYVEGIPAWQLFSAGYLKPEYAHLAERIIDGLAQDAALADVVNKGDRDVGVRGKPWGNYIFVPSADGQEFVRIVSIDHEFVYNRTDIFTIQSAEDGHLEMSFLAALPGFCDPIQRAALFTRFKIAYMAMLSKIRQERPKVEGLIRQCYGEGEELKLFASGLARDPEVWLATLFSKVELFWQHRQGAGAGRPLS